VHPKTAGRTNTGGPVFSAKKSDFKKLTENWPGSKLLRVPQGHFGYRALRKTMTQVEPLITG